MKIVNSFSNELIYRLIHIKKMKKKIPIPDFQHLKKITMSRQNKKPTLGS